MMPLFMVMPVRGVTKREPKVDSRVCVTAAMLPSRSTAEKCVVQAGAIASAPSERRPSWMSWIVNDRVRGNVIAIDGRELWLLHRSVPGTDFDAVDLDASMQALLGAPEPIEYEVVHHEDWVGRRLVAERFRDGNVFIAGDAAHLWVPYAGYGMNAGIADGVELAFLFAAVLDGWAPPTILDAYEA